VSDAFTAGHLATEVGVRLLVVGERSGDLGDVMERIAAFYDEETARAVEWFSRLFEPLLMVLIGLVIGGIVVMMYLPIFELASSIQ
ncbi:MAG TPA: type II secretion system F family protein, partial [Rhodocyclaceae bacterium]|nr:type II secretion system F family protein [Rhodocyclaceae bacterium]